MLYFITSIFKMLYLWNTCYLVVSTLNKYTIEYIYFFFKHIEKKHYNISLKKLFSKSIQEYKFQSQNFRQYTILHVIYFE